MFQFRACGRRDRNLHHFGVGAISTMAKRFIAVFTPSNAQIPIRGYTDHGESGKHDITKVN